MFIIFAFQKHFKIFYFILLLQIHIFFVFLNHFDALISKIILKKIKKNYFNAFTSKKKHFEKQPHFHQIFYTCFLLHINFNHNFYQTRI